ncbi:MAG: helix-turn-helix domain-containing protein [Scandinavium sp.]|uniref:helix-turn-helix domain-containing protein n=1 Tax=Scandinavium sp. TaxID=2830653 RepID=UPI003F34D3C9
MNAVNVTSVDEYYHFLTVCKPLAAITRIIDQLSGNTTTMNFPSGKRIDPVIGGVRHIIFLMSGNLSVFRTSDNLAMGCTSAPTLLGLADGYAEEQSMAAGTDTWLISDTRCQCKFIPVSLFMQKSEELGLWRDISTVLAHRIIAMTMRDKYMVGQDAYGKIRVLLLEIWSLPQEVRCEINIQRFIQQRTGLSRSGILKILTELRTGGYIKTLHGRLMALGELPQRR